EVTDAATVLEFLAWGRRKEVHFATHSLSPDINFKASNGADYGFPSPSGRRHGLRSDVNDAAPLHVLQTLLPDKAQVATLVDYHIKCLLWFHGSFHGPTFARQVTAFYADYGGNICHPDVDLQWIALLFAVLTGCMACGNEDQLSECGFLLEERELLSSRWFQAVTTCLDAAHYMANLSIRACEAIATMTMSAHILGFSNQQSILLASAARVAQSLGLHRLDDSTPLNVERESGRRLWTQLCSQDWFGIPFSDSYSINPLHSHTVPPLNCHDTTLDELPLTEPTVTTYCRFLNDIAHLMPRLHDAVALSNTTFTRYEQVLKYDRKMRAIASDQRPACLRSGPVNPSWPRWVAWARRAVAVTSAHKIIMIHRKYLTLSFTNPAFSFTRATCIAASKTIMHEIGQLEEDGPTFWIYHAFTVAACITLCLDIIHREISDPRCPEHRTLVESGLAYLSQASNSRLASRGAQVLSGL
ncbi:hypothetical protein BAUCODRAFT_46052, partial [Baudoinia panamericana UAMH 10762]